MAPGSSLRVRDWPVRRKIVALLVAASLLPLAISALIQLRTTRASLLDATGALLAARADQLRRQIEALELGYELTATKLSRLPAVLGFATAPGPIREILAVNVTSDHNLLAIAVLDATGVVRVASEPRLEGTAPTGVDLQAALRGSTLSSDPFLAAGPLAGTPVFVIAAPIQDARGTLGVVVLWIRASALWNLARASNELAGPGSFAVVVDDHGIRIAHSSDDALVFRPTAPLAPDAADAVVRGARFGAATRRWLADVHPFPELHARATAPYPGTELFRGHSSVYGWTHGVARRLSTNRWTVFYLQPERAIDDEVAALARRQAVQIGAITLAVFALGLVMAHLILRPVAALAAATARIGAGDLSARVPATTRSAELARLAASFNAMAARIEGDDAALRRSRDELERRVTERTLALEAQTARLAQLAQTGHELAAASGDAREVLTLAATRLGEQLGEICSVRLISEDGRWLEASTAVYHADPALRARIAAVLNTGRVPLDETIGGKVAATGEPLRIAEVTGERAAELARDAPAFRPLIDPIGITSVLVVPLRSRAKTIGVVCLLRVAPDHPYSLDDQHFAQEVADRAGLAIDNAVLVEQLERRVAARTAALEAANQELEAFSYSVSHDLRAPLRTIAGFSQVLLADHAAQLDDEGLGYLRRVCGATQRMAALIDDLLNLARITRSHLRWTDVDLSALADQVIAELRRRDPARTTAVHVASGLHHRGDARLLAIALENLLGNAWKFTAKHPAAEIWLEAGDDAATFRVRDTGAGFDMAHADKLFVPFQRLHVPTDYEGTGIGLATVQRIVQRHGGRIWAEAAPDRGATFAFSLGEPS